MAGSVSTRPRQGADFRGVGAADQGQLPGMAAKLALAATSGPSGPALNFAKTGRSPSVTYVFACKNSEALVGRDLGTVTVKEIL